MTDNLNPQQPKSEQTAAGEDIHWSETLRKIDDAILITNRSGKIEFLNPTAELLLGLEADRCRGNYMRDVMRLSDDETGEVIECCAVTLTRDDPTCARPFTGVLTRVDGKAIPIDGTAALVNTDDEQSHESVWILRDVSGRKLIEAMLHESEMRFNLLADSTADVMIIADSKKRVSFWNGAAERLSGYTANEVIGKDLTHHVRFTIRADEVSKHGGTNEHLSYYNYLDSITQMEIATKEGEYCPVDASFSSIQLKGDWHTVLICRDIRERKRAEREIIKYRLQLEDLVQERTRELLGANRQLKKEIVQRVSEAEQRRKLEERIRKAEKMESLGILAGGVAHDLNNMLSPLLGYPQLILGSIPADSKIKPMVEKIGRAAEDAIAIVDDLHTLSRRGRCELNPVCLNEVVERFLKSPMLERLISRNPGIKVNINLSENLPNVSGSGHHLLKVIMNLVINAFDAMEETGTLTIQTDAARLSKLINGYENITPGEYIMLRIRDTGAGIPEDKRKRIFEPYFSTKQMDESGTGLGLAIVHGVVKDHNGYYDVISQVGRGTEFILYFPIANSQVITSSHEMLELGGVEKILIVDDIESQRQLASDILTHLGYETISAASGREAVEYLRDHQVDLVVIDMVMETNFDGLDTYLEISQINPQQRTLLVSGHPVSERVDEAQRMGAGPFIKKPLDLNKMSEAIKNVIPG